MLPMEKSVTFTGACANEIIPSIKRSFVYKAKELQIMFCVYYAMHKKIKATTNCLKGADTSAVQVFVNILLFHIRVYTGTVCPRRATQSFIKKKSLKIPKM